MHDIISDNGFLWWSTAIVGVVVSVLLYVFFFIQRKQKSMSNEELAESINNSSEPSKLLNIFDISKKTRTTSQASSHKLGTDSNDNSRPFNSSYYYAHNNSKVGYKDGLSMEDYVMNQPKLLSKNGVAVKSTQSSTSEESKGTPSKESTNQNITPVSTKVNSSPFYSIPLNRYLWDDDGNSNGIAKLYFDTLPSASIKGVSEISWKDSGITSKDVKVKVINQLDSNCALLIQIKRCPNAQDNLMDRKNTRYHFYVPQLYGQIQEAKAIIRSELLIVKLIKEKKKKGNFQAWPQIHAKGAPSKDYIDIDLFLDDTYD